MMCSVRFFVELPRANLKAALRSRNDICINKEDILVGKVNFKNHHYETLHRHKVLRTNEWAKFLKFLIFEKLLKFKSQQSASIHSTILFLNCQKCSFHWRACREEKRRGVTFVFCLMAAPSASWTSWPETKAKMSLFQSKENVEGKCWFHLHPPNPVANGGNDEWNSSVCRSLVDAVPLAVVCQITIRHQDAPESAGSRNMFTAFTDPLSCCTQLKFEYFSVDCCHFVYKSNEVSSCTTWPWVQGTLMWRQCVSSLIRKWRVVVEQVACTMTSCTPKVTRCRPKNRVSTAAVARARSGVTCRSARTLTTCTHRPSVAFWSNAKAAAVPNCIVVSDASLNQFEFHYKITGSTLKIHISYLNSSNYYYLYTVR